MKREQIISYFFIALLIFVTVQICAIFTPFSNAIFWSAILAFTFFPLYEKLKKTLGGKETIASVLMTILIFLVVIPPLAILVVNITGQAIELSQSAVHYIKSGKLEQLIESIRSITFIQSVEEQLLEWDIIKNSAESWILNSTRAIGNFTAFQVGMVTKNIFAVMLNIIIMTFLVFIFLKDGHKIYGFLYDVAPMEESNKKEIFSQITGTFGAVIRGQLLTCLAQATVAGMTFWMLGVPVPILFGIATFITALIPVVGAAGIWIPVTIYLVFQEAYVQALILFLVGALIISVIDNILKPAIIGEKTKLPYFLLLFGILGGLQIYGLLGVFLAPVVISLFFSLTKIYQENYL